VEVASEPLVAANVISLSLTGSWSVSWSMITNAESLAMTPKSRIPVGYSSLWWATKEILTKTINDAVLDDCKLLETI